MEILEKKFFAFAILALLIVSTFSAMSVKADNEDDEDKIVSDIYTNQMLVGSMSSGVGADVRLLQLERHVQRNYLRGSYVIDAIAEFDVEIEEENLDKLKELTSDMSDLREKIEDAREDDSLDNEELADLFLEYKDDATRISSDFRLLLHDELTISDLEEVMDYVNDQDYSSLDNYTNKIRELTLEQHIERIQYILDALGIDDEDLLERVENGDITISEINEIIRDHYNDLSYEERKEFRENMAEYRESNLNFVGLAIGKRMGFGNEFSGLMKNKDLSWSEKKAKFNVMVRDKVHKNFGEGRGNGYGQGMGGGRFK